MNDSPLRSRLVAVLGPTNTGKTHLAVERMLAHSSGMIGLPLRLLAREIYDRIVKTRGARCVALITGEEKIVPAHPQYFVCTVEAMPLDRKVDFLAVDEIQLCADPERGHVFTHRLLHARGAHETMLMGAATMAPLVRRLCPGAEIQFRERLSTLSYAGPKKLTRLPRRSAVVAFSADAVYAIAELIRRHRGGAAVVMGSLSPRTRNAQVGLFQSGEVDFLVATDAIGMGLNMEVDHVAFAGLRKFDGRRTRSLYAQEIGQIAGRAGRFRRDGSFGVTGDAPDLDPEIVGAVEGHVFPPVPSAEWRNPALDFASLQSLMRSLADSPPTHGLRLSEEAQDEVTLRQLSADELVSRRVRDRANLRRLWEACQTPDFRKTTQDEHTRLIGGLFEHLTQGDRRVPEDWMHGQFAALDRTDGDIDALQTRLARVRTLAYIANRSDWLADPQAWQGSARALEDRLSDTLHQSLMQRFVDRRTSTLLRSLHQHAGPVLGGIAADGEVTVEGHVVGRLTGVHFEPARADTALEARALRGAVERAVAPEVARRLGELAGEGDEAFALGDGGVVAWRGLAAGEIVGGRPFKPRVRLIGEFGQDAARERAARRLEAYVAAEASRHLAPLKHLIEAIADGRLRGLARGVAYQLVEQSGVLDRRAAEEHIRALSRGERRILKSFGVRFGAYALFLPGLLTEEAKALGAVFAELAAPRWRPPHDAVSVLPHPVPPPEALSLRGLAAVAGFAIPVQSLERFDALARAAPSARPDLVEAAPALVAAVGWKPAQADAILRALGFVRVKAAEPGETSLWRRRPLLPRPAALAAGPAAAEARAAPSPAPTRKGRRRRPRRPVSSASGPSA
ncbi:ATP-dependent RNA helicase SUPV3L1/SUV3 [Roseiarcus fermentans]|uniref:ATP-dependent RNA helicase SUPV3L1/SUV3 n=1 Tax=Roseiarcus fermentans TaxID=1473586 RepID=A0A366FQ56_9HYPH|nr:helicase-related protein [Roseiarcus fermentans]RBP16170.1 ATP-dependent RNA helicase SUPV3L1/SUV3 [Roseiarcus fermentans]